MQSFGRNGSGLLITLVLILLVVLLTLGIHGYRLSGRVSRDLAVNIKGERAIFMAESAIEDALFEVSLQVNRPDSALFTRFRDQSAGLGSFEKTIAVPRFEDVLESSNSKIKLQEGGVRMQVVYQAPFTDLPYEKYGVVRFQAQLSDTLGFGRKLKRRVESFREFKMVLVSPPRPFDQASFFVQDCTGYITPDFENKNIKDSRADLKKAIPDLRKYYHDYIEAEFRTYEDHVNIDEFHALIDNPPLNPSMPDVKLYGSEILAYSRKPSIPRLEELNLPAKILEINQKIIQGAADVKQAATSLDHAINQALDALDQSLVESSVKPAMRRFARLTHELSNLHVQRLSIYEDFQALVRTVSGSAYQHIAGFYYKYNQDEWRKKAFHVLEETQDINQAMDQFLEQFNPANGVLFVENPTQTLVLENRQIPGKLIIVTSGAIKLSNLEPLDPNRHLLSVVSYGRLSATGRVVAALSPMGEFLVPGGVFQLKGNLVLRQVIKPDQLRGALEFDPEIFSGTTTSASDAKAKKSHYYLGFSPLPLALNLNRNPGLN